MPVAMALMRPWLGIQCKVGLVNTTRLVHSRSHKSPVAQRLRKTACGVETFRNPKASRYVKAPTDLSLPGRSKYTSRTRQMLADSNRPDELLMILQTAIGSGKIDASVFGAAMQRCGQGRWWDALLQVLDMRTAQRVHLFHVQRTICLKSLREALRGDKFGTVKGRPVKALEIAKEVWKEPENDVDEANRVIQLNAAMSLAAETSDIGGLAWGQELWEWAISKSLPLTIISYSEYMHLLETCRLHDGVDDLLDSAAFVPNQATLGLLVNTAAEQRNYLRAEFIWSKLVGDMSVSPSTISYGARAKAHLLCGRPRSAALCLDEMLSKGLELSPTVAECHVQSLLIVCHSSLASSDMDRLCNAFQKGAPVIGGASSWQKRTWRKLQKVFEMLQDDLFHIPFVDVLVEWKAQQSEMSSWPNHRAGTNYLRENVQRIS